MLLPASSRGTMVAHVPLGSLRLYAHTSSSWHYCNSTYELHFNTSKQHPNFCWWRFPYSETTAQQTHGFGVICRGECGHLSRFSSISCYAKSGDPHILQMPQSGLIGACCLAQRIFNTLLLLLLLFAVLNGEYRPQRVLSAGAALEACHTKIPWNSERNMPTLRHGGCAHVHE